MKLLETYRMEFSNAACRPESQTLHCIAYLDQDVGAALPYLNAVLGGYTYIREPPSVTLRSQGKLITVHADRIAINAIREPAEAEKILLWLQREINAAWENREAIEPSCQAAPRPQVLEILRHLPKTNCRQCGQPSCTVFAVQVAEGGRGAADCPALSPEAAQRLTAYLDGFRFDL
ncbi:MAG: Fe-S cluster protein [Deltaproteobacteria bacterium CG_4_10_14_3_um_filter_60_8]|nr:MAG: Fe-S cluster protein [Deltaproteobacteria bacterium CG_4_10_14_3_um_filter_60_8]